ncbi:hypothetical protein CXF68_08565 [Tenacibaculum sp. Bg11-29]|uniref:hypothetical protein n=1 Tax=Tenacibaculum sp. Bg11-29 TaxID=2058306 RepID=UPI000C33906D|nr:hypothetical protein [Tenacibaculum sp. Bg11-29]PKH50740.1 hypothetical protein CXF68_08565 [Tenacibaculum sp. Bg11-29]
MEIKGAIVKIKKFKVTEETEDYEISDFFDEISEQLTPIDSLVTLQKKELIDILFEFLKSQDAEMDENFSFIHFVESINKPDYEIYYPKLIKFNTENATITSILLLNRFINSLEGVALKKCVALLKNISDNNKYSKYLREFTLEFYEHQTNN